MKDPWKATIVIIALLCSCTLKVQIGSRNTIHTELGKAAMDTKIEAKAEDIGQGNVSEVATKKSSGDTIEITEKKESGILNWLWEKTLGKIF